MVLAVVVLVVLAAGPAAAGRPGAAGPATWPDGESAPAFQLPVATDATGLRGRVLRPFIRPAHRYGPGHRGVDLSLGQSPDVTSPAAGVVDFAGMVAGRPVVVIDHGRGWRSALEPVVARVPVGTVVRRGDPLGAAAVAPPSGGAPAQTGPGAGESPAAGSGHCRVPCVHWGVRHHGRYVDPMSLVTAPIVLLPDPRRWSGWPPWLSPTPQAASAAA